MSVLIQLRIMLSLFLLSPVFCSLKASGRNLCFNLDFAAAHCCILPVTSTKNMNSFLLLLVLLLSFAVLILAFFALSSCLGDEFRAAWSGRQTRSIPTTFGMQYARMMGTGNSQAGWEQIEMQDMFDEDAQARRR